MRKCDYNKFMSKKRAKNQRKVPDWARKPFSDVLELFQELNDVLAISKQGIRSLQGMPGIVKALEEYDAGSDEELTDEAKSKIENAERLAKLAKREAEADFPLLNSQATVSIWGYLEGAIRNFLVSWMHNQPGVRKIPEIAKLKIRLMEYEELDETEKSYYLLDLLNSDIGGSYKRGVNKFEDVFRVFGLSGPVEDEVKQGLYELYEIRNVIVHRHSKADTKLLEACPWLKFKLGEKIVITEAMFRKYEKAVAEYITEVLDRVFHQFGRSFREFLDKQALDTISQKG